MKKNLLLIIIITINGCVINSHKVVMTPTQKKVIDAKKDYSTISNSAMYILLLSSIVIPYYIMKNRVKK